MSVIVYSFANILGYRVETVYYEHVMKHDI